MAETPESLLALQIGGASIADNLRRAIESGVLKQHDDGTWELVKREDRGPSPWLFRRVGPPLGCTFRAGFLFGCAYGSAAVPQSCERCYKIKVIPRTLRELVALWSVAQRIAYRCKCGLDLRNSYSQNIYAGIFYASDLDGARAAYRIVREAVNADTSLGAGVPMVIKRGCSEYEAACGPSDTYRFRPEMPELEAFLKSRFRRSPNNKPDTLATIVSWIDTAYRIGDDTYLDFTGGKPLRPRTMFYDPEG